VTRARNACRRAVLGIAAGILVAACAAPKPVYRTDRTPYRFTIDRDLADKSKCKVEVDFKNCDPHLKPNDPGQRKDCLRALGGQDVVFASSVGEFELQFDPFGKTSIPSSGGSTPPLPVRELTQHGSKPHTFWVKAASCPPVDPEIIIDW
jgi:hypothetical protein